MKRLLVTGFQPFDGNKLNPSLEAAREITRYSFGDTRTQIVELPVERLPAVEIALEAIATARPDLVIMLGQADGRSRITPERVAVNIDDYRIPDNAGEQPRGEPIITGGPVGYFSTLPVSAIVDRLTSALIPAAISNTAGTYLCNRLFYSVMHYLSTSGADVTAGFIHLPCLHEQAIEKNADIPSMSRETIVEGVRLAIELSVKALLAEQR